MSYLVSPTFHFKETWLLYMLHSFHAGTKNVLFENKQVCGSSLSIPAFNALCSSSPYWPNSPSKGILEVLVTGANHTTLLQKHSESETPAMKKRLGLFLVTALPLILFWSVTVSNGLSSENSEISPSHHQQNRLAHQHGSEQVCKQRLPHSPLAAFASNV